MTASSSDLPEGVRAAVEDALHSTVRSIRRLHGGDINDAFRVTLDGGAEAFVKTNKRAAPTLFSTEARGLLWLSEPKALRVPKVWAVAEEGSPDPFLLLEHIEPGARAADFDERLGRGLAQLHRYGAPGFGLDYDNFIGSLPQVNQPHDRWHDFYRAERLEPQLRRATDRGLTTAAMRAGFERLFARLEDRCGTPEPPSRLHGDLWSGNIHVDESGYPTLIDPAVYGGHREVDLAMLELFGGVSAQVIDAYNDVFPLSKGWKERVGLYQLYPLLVHINLFGATYVGSLERTLTRC